MLKNRRIQHVDNPNASVDEESPIVGYYNLIILPSIQEMTWVDGVSLSSDGHVTGETVSVPNEVTLAVPNADVPVTAHVKKPEKFRWTEFQEVRKK